ncbi:hypothetical protein MRX96_010221 [Rhipicephalus microplus]
MLRQARSLKMLSQVPELKLVLQSVYDALFLICSNTQELVGLPCLTAAEGTLSTLLASQAAIQAKSHDTADNEKHFLAALLSILMLCDYHTSEFTSVLVSVVEKLDGWREFESSSLGKATSESLQSLLMPYLHSVVASLATPILTSAREKQCLWLHQMWEEIEQHFRTSRHDLQGESLLVELLSCTMAVVPTLPAPLLACLTRLSGLAAKVGVVSANNSAGMQVLLSTLYDILHSSTQLNELFGSLLDSEISVECAHIANEMAAHALQLTQRQEDRLLGSPDCDQRVLNCLDLLAGLLAAERDASREESLSQTAEDITLDLVAEQLMRTPQGPQNIEYLHTVLHQNEAWIRHTLAIPALDHHSVTLPLHNALLLGSSRQATREPRFDPLQAYNACMRIVQECDKVQTPQ